MNEFEVKKAFDILVNYCRSKDADGCGECMLNPCPACVPEMVNEPNGLMSANDTISHSIDNLITHPAHYTDGKIEVWDFIADKKLSFFSGNVIKYVCRAGKKDPDKRIEDLKKARAYIDKQIELWESESK